jgi:hypothetical protein
VGGGRKEDHPCNVVGVDFVGEDDLGGGDEGVLCGGERLICISASSCLSSPSPHCRFIVRLAGGWLKERVLEAALWGPVLALVTAVVAATAAHPWRRRGPDHGDGSSASMLLQKLELAGGKIYWSPDAFLGV